MWNTVKCEIFLKPQETVKMLLPAAFYTLQNNLLLTALTYLDSLTFQVGLTRVK